MPYQAFGSHTGQPGFVGGYGHLPANTCAFWPVPPTTQPHRASAPGLPTVLVISTTDDPATPYQDGVDLAEQLGGALLTFEGSQHTASFYGNECVDDATTTLPARPHVAAQGHSGACRLRNADRSRASRVPLPARGRKISGDSAIDSVTLECVNVRLYTTPDDFGCVARWVYRRDPVRFTTELTTMRHVEVAG